MLFKQPCILRMLSQHCSIIIAVITNKLLTLAKTGKSTIKKMVVLSIATKRERAVKGTYIYLIVFQIQGHTCMFFYFFI